MILRRLWCNWLWLRLRFRLRLRGSLLNGLLRLSLLVSRSLLCRLGEIQLRTRCSKIDKVRVRNRGRMRLSYGVLWMVVNCLMHWHGLWMWGNVRGFMRTIINLMSRLWMDHSLVGVGRSIDLVMRRGMSCQVMVLLPHNVWVPTVILTHSLLKVALWLFNLVV